MSKISITDETAARAVIIAYIDAIPLAGNVFDRRRSVNSRKDFFQKLGVEVDNKTEIRFVEVELIAIDDDPTEGFDDCPVAALTYNLHCFHQFADDRGAGSNSDKDFNDLLLRLRTFFLDTREFNISNWKVELDPIVSTEFTQFGNDTFTDVKGYFKDLTLKAYFYDQ